MTVSSLNRYACQFVFLQVSYFFMFFGINLSFFFFARFMFSAAGPRLHMIFFADTILRKFIMLFMLGALLSAFYNLWEGDLTAFTNSRIVLFNYIYWAVMMMLMTALGPLRVLDLNRLFKIVTLAVLIVCVYYTLFQEFISSRLFFKNFNPNSFSFLLICYTPYLVHYTRRRINPVVALALFGFLLLVQLSEGRRAGFALILVGGMSSYFVHFLKFNSIGRIVRPVILLILGWILLQTQFIEERIRAGSSRVHQMIYSDGQQWENDRSLLIRRAMVEKGLSLFTENMWFGAGINNFMRVEGQIDGDFEGSKFVVRKRAVQRISSHNSYINILAEGGLVLAVPFAGILLFLFLNGVKYFARMQDLEKVVSISFVVMSVHLYFYNGIVNSLAWFNIAVFGYILSSHKYRIR